MLVWELLIDVDVCCSLFAVSGSRFLSCVVCGLMFVARCVLLVACVFVLVSCLLTVACCWLFVVRGVRFVVLLFWRLVFVVRWLLCFVCVLKSMVVVVVCVRVSFVVCCSLCVGGCCVFEVCC